jgi:hypothetical protein
MMVPIPMAVMPYILTAQNLSVMVVIAFVKMMDLVLILKLLPGL